MAMRALGGCPIHAREEGMKRASGMRFKTAIRRLLVSLISPNSSSSTGKSALCSKWVNRVSCCRSVSCILAPRVAGLGSILLRTGVFLQKESIKIFYFTDFCKYPLELSDAALPGRHPDE